MRCFCSARGSQGNDYVVGGGGNDALCGKGGADTLNGDTGDDALTGGLGEDVFVFGDGDGEGNDAITDFDCGDDDTDGFTNDQLDVTALTDGLGSGITVFDVSVTDTVGEGSGDTILQFPTGMSITLSGVDPATLDIATLNSMGIP